MITSMQPRYYKLMAVAAVAGSLAASLMLLERHKDKSSTPATEQATTPGSSGNPTADRVHELKGLEEELKKKPDHPPILFRMAQLASELGKPAEAVGYLRRLVKVEPGNIEARLELGRLLWETDDFKSALAETKKILETNPKQVDALYNVGAIYANLNQEDMAKEYWRRAVASDAASDSGKRASEGLQKLAASAIVPASSGAPNGWTHPAISSSSLTH
jgi:tetratricopeptide (TPR) repeat protein